MEKENNSKRNGVIKLIIQKSEETFELGDFVEGVINFRGKKYTKSDESDVLGEKSKECKVLGQYWE